MKARLLAVDDDINKFIERKVEWEKHGINCVRVSSMQEAIELLTKEEIAIIGINADNINYMQLLSIMRNLSSAPIYILTSNFDFNKQVDALKYGADHYQEWGHNIEESIYIGVLMLQKYIERNNRPKQSSKYIFYKDVFVYPIHHRVFIKDIAITLTRKEFDVLHLLISDPDRIYTSKQIIRRIWGDEYIDGDNMVLWNVIKRLRKKLKVGVNSFNYIKNVRDVGYTFDL